MAGRVRERRLEHFLEARYAHQVWTLELPLGERVPTAPEHVDELVAEFHDLHERIFAVRDPDQRVEILQCRGRLVARPFTPPLGDAVSPPRANGRPRRRLAYFPGHGKIETAVYEGGTIAPGAELAGPLVVAEPSTTVVVPPGVTLHSTKLGNYVLELR
jgi:N-methylhydantoinase A